MAMVDLEIFDAYFREADLDNDGRISGAEAVPFFQRSNLPKQILAQIWFHVDQNRTGFLGRSEFYNALKLVTVVQSGRELNADIVKAALFGPASPKIPAPKINPAPASATLTNSVTMPPHLSSMVPPFTQTGAAISAPQESEFEEDDGLIIDTSAGKIELSNMQVLDDKDLVELQILGSGGFGTVYRGKWKGTDVAIKRINNSCYTGQPYEDRLILDTFREAGLLASLHHPNIVSFYGFARDELKNTLAIVTELVVDGSLRNILFRKSKYLDYRKRLIIAMDAAFGMEYLHLSKIVHFDLKCANLLVDLKDPSKPICKVADFGLSKVKQDTLVSGGIRGTLPWMAPELLRGDRSKVSEKVDVYSFGIVMWEILTGKLPYTGMFEGEIIGGIFNNTLRPPVPASCDPNWRKLMEECWASDPQKRPTFKQIAGRLHSMLVVNYVEAS